MKKSTGALGVAVILGAAYLGTTWYVGKEAQKTIEAAVVQANQRLAALLGPGSGSERGQAVARIDIDDYQRRFFSSDVLYTLRLKDENNHPIDIALKDHLQHGPFSFDAWRDGHFMPLLAYSKAQLVATPATQSWVDSQKGGTPLLIRTRVDFGGAGQSTWTFLPAELAGQDLRASFSGGAVVMDFSNDFKDSTSTGHFQTLDLDNGQAGEKLQLSDVALSSQSRAGDDDVVQTQTRVTIATLVMGNAGDEAVTVEQLEAGLDSEQDADILSGSLRYDFGRIAVGSADLGSLSLTARVQQLDVAALTALATDYDAIAAKHGGQIGQAEALSREDQKRLRDRLAAVLASDPSVAIEPVVWKNVKGESRASVQVDLADPQRPDEQSVDELFVQGLKQVKFDLSLSKPMFIHALGQAETEADKKLQMEMLGAMIYDQYVGRLQSAGLISVDGDVAASSVLYEQGGVNVNGQAMTVPEFMQRVFSVVM